MADYHITTSQNSNAVAVFLCPTCRTAMLLRRTVPLANGYEQRSFACERCERWDNFVNAAAFSSRVRPERTV